MLRFAVAALALAGICALSVPAMAIQTVTIPSPMAQASPDGDPVFDKSIPDAWQSKSDQSTSSTTSGFGGFHFSMSGSNGGATNGFGQSGFGPGSYGPYPTGSSPKSWAPMPSPSAAAVPGSEFYQPMPGYTPY